MTAVELKKIVENSNMTTKHKGVFMAFVEAIAEINGEDLEAGEEEPPQEK